MSKKAFLTISAIFISCASFSQQALYDITPGNGNGIRFWQSDMYKIHMGNTSEYRFGPVTDYSIKANMNEDVGRGWTWGVYGQTPVAAISNTGHMKIANHFESNGNIVSYRASRGYLGLTAELPGYAEGEFPTLRTSHKYLYFSAHGKYSAVLGDSEPMFGVNDATGYLKVVLHSNGNSYFNGGNLGIGTANPQGKLQVVGGEIHLDADQALRGGGRWLISGNSSQVTVGTTNPDVHLKFDAGAAYRMFINGSTGNVGIGTSSPDQKLTVKGKIHAEEVIIDLSVPAPDYVFEKNYPLTPLDTLQEYIAQHKHLPEVPSAKEMEKEGVKVGQMEMILLKKIEEITLHLIEMKKLNDAQSAQMMKMQEELNQLRKK